MGEHFRDRDFRKLIYTLLLPGCVLTALALLWDTRAGLACGLQLAITLVAITRFVGRRNRQLADFTEALVSIASGDYRVNIADYAEGELSILASEMMKLTATLTHQAEQLRGDKAFLADALADISHQLRTPLTSMSVLADLLASPNLPDDRHAEFLRGLRTAIDRTEWLIASLLKLSRLDAGSVVFTLKPVPVGEVVEAALSPLRIPMEIREQTLLLDLPDDLCIDTDSHWLAEAVGNLIKNACEHAGRGGRIAISASRTVLYTELRVADSGPGIPPEDLAHIFDRFYRGTNAAPDSVGIGLALSRQIVAGLGGTLNAENSAEGTVFTLKLYGDTVV